MITKNEILIAASPQKIFELAAQTPKWPDILPHYRFVHTLEQSSSGLESTIHMGARRDSIPVQWTAKQTNLPEIPEIRFTHIRGWTRGMDVVWRFIPQNGKTLVIIEHELKFRFPVASEWIGEHIVGNFFVHNIANKTLAKMKELAEAAA